MKGVRFIKELNEFDYFNYPEGISSFPYIPSTRNLWKSIDTNKFIIDLCINPYLSKELDIFELCLADEKCGYIFPICLLDSNEDLSEYGNLNSYIFIAFQVLLERIPEIKDTDLFSNNFEDNICVCILHKDYIPASAESINDIIHILRYYGYSFFYEKNNVGKIPFYKYIKFKLTSKRIKINFKKPALYHDPIIQDLIRVIPTINNMMHRYVLLYQCIEHIIRIIQDNEVKRIISMYQNTYLPSNDFIKDISNISSEKKRIKLLFASEIRSDIRQDFESSCRQIMGIIGYPHENIQDISELFYSFRNLMTHDYRKLHHFPNEVGETIQDFEKLVFNILATYKPEKC